MVALTGLHPRCRRLGSARLGDLRQRWGSVAETGGSVVRTAGMSGNPTWASELEDRVETDVAGRECCTRNAGNEASTKSGNEKVKCPKKRRKGP